MGLLWIFVGWLWARGAEGESQRSMRVLAVGNMPPFRQEVRDGVRYELPPPPGSIPPRTLGLVRMLEQTAEERGEFRVHLGRISAEIELPEGVARLRLVGDGGTPWTTLSCPEEGDFLLLLWRDPLVGDWSKPRTKVVPDEREAGMVKFLNVSRRTVALVVGGRSQALRPLQTWKAPLSGSEPVSFQLGQVRQGGRLERAISVALEQSDDESTLVILSDSDGERVRKPLKVTRLRERVR
ncbi:MAG: hypothetical protein ACQKBU_09775 [Verrucomicrobiales bacterium]